MFYYKKLFNIAIYFEKIKIDIKMRIVDYIYSFWRKKKRCECCGRMYYQERLNNQPIHYTCSFTCAMGLITVLYPHLHPDIENIKIPNFVFEDQVDESSFS